MKIYLFSVSYWNNGQITKSIVLKAFENKADAERELETQFLDALMSRENCKGSIENGIYSIFTNERMSLSFSIAQTELIK